MKEYILYHDHHILVANKPAGMSSQPTKSEEKSLKDLLEIYCKHTLYVINRIDTPVSGVIIFAKNKTAAHNLSEQFQKKTITKKYLAVVTPMDSEEGELINYLLKVKNKSQVVTESDNSAKEAKLTYKTVARSDKYQVLEVTPLTGRFHQIRAQLANAGAFIKGDVKYGARRSNKDRSIHLHSHQVIFMHPTKNEEQKYTAPLPENDSLWAFVKTEI